MAFGIDTLIGEGLKIVNKFIPDPAENAKAEQALRDWLTGIDFKQMDVNKQEAAHSSIFVAGWRPFVGWTCGASFALNFVIFPIVNYFTELFGFVPVVIRFDMETLMTVLLGMLGLACDRDWETNIDE